ncbi:MAG TPA: CNNM domain-containing protein [Haliangiales bacterium]|nr:CNNM domain-containing protein [Haliangiales bacterium]
MEYGRVIVLVMALSFAFSFFLSGMEAGVFALSRLRIRQLMRAGSARAKVLHGYLEQPEDFLWTILVGNTLANFVAVSLAVIGLHHRFSSSPAVFWAIFLAGGFFFYAICELLPKVLFRTLPNRLCVALVGPFRLVHAALSPLVALLSKLARVLLRWTGGRTFTGHLFGTREEFRLVMQESAQAFTSEERAMINRVLDLQHLTAGQLTTPLSRAVSVGTRTAMNDVLRLCREHNLTRLPVWRDEGNRRRIVGVVSLKTLLYQSDFDAGKTAGDYVKPALYLGEEMRLEEALRRMQRSGQRLAIVLGRDQREVGLISLQDVLKFVFGEISL